MSAAFWASKPAFGLSPPKKLRCGDAARSPRRFGSTGTDAVELATRLEWAGFGSIAVVGTAAGTQRDAAPAAWRWELASHPDFLSINASVQVLSLTNRCRGHSGSSGSSLGPRCPSCPGTGCFPAFDTVADAHPPVPPTSPTHPPSPAMGQLTPPSVGWLEEGTRRRGVGKFRGTHT